MDFNTWQYITPRCDVESYIVILFNNQCDEELIFELYNQSNFNLFDSVLGLLGDSLIHKEDFTHSYPYDWRTKKPVIICASRQWFIDTSALKVKALVSIHY